MTHDDAMAVICSSAELFFSNKQYQGPAESRLEIGLTTQKVEGIENGYYILRGAAGRLEKKDTGNFHQRLARICLDQTWISRSALNIIFVCDLKSLENEMGSKGYARVFMHAGRIAQRIYLAAEALGLGCCGVGALYDEEAQDLLGLDADNAVFYVVSVGLVHRSTGIP